MKQAKQRLTRFINEKLNGDIEALADFNMELLRHPGYEDFTCKASRFEYDNSELVKDIFVVLWHDTFHGSGLELTSDTVGDGKAFRGDTLHTTGTIAGKYWQPLRIICQYSQAQVMALQQRLHVSHIGNMLLLPSFSIKRGERNYVTINTYRGCHPQWHDYFDAFLHNLKPLLPVTADATPDDHLTLKTLVLHKGSRTFFQSFHSFEDWIHAMLLDDCLDQQTHEPYRLWPDLTFSDYPFYWRFDTRSDAERQEMPMLDPERPPERQNLHHLDKLQPTPEQVQDYRYRISSFISKVNELVDKRGLRMAQALKERL